MADDTKTWALIHPERAALADLLETLTLAQWDTASLCSGWTVRMMAAHIMAGAEQTTGNFLKGMARYGFRFNTYMDKTARRLGTLETAEIVRRIRARSTTTNHPPAPVMAMLGEVVVHGEDIRRPLGLQGQVAPAAVRACLDMYRGATFPVGGKKRIQGLRLTATDVDWSHGSGPDVAGPGMSLIMAMTGRRGGAEGLTGDGVPVLRQRLEAGSRISAAAD